MHRDLYYLTHRQSDAIKGVLILLIVLGHIHSFNVNTPNGDMRTYLYSFHVMCFFMLPFFYKHKGEGISWKKVLDIIARSWVPYIWILLLCLVAVYFVRRQFYIGYESFLALINGTQTPLSKYFGFVFPWFLPAYCSFSLLLLAGRRYKVIYWLVTFLSVGTYFFTYNQFFEFKMSMPFAFGLAICYFSFGAIAFELNRVASWIRYVMALLFVSLSICWWLNFNIFPVIYKFLPITFFFLILCLLPIIDCNFLRSIGRNSLGIYLFNVFFANAAYMLLPHSFVYGILSFLICVIAPWAITKVINKIAFLRRLLFPHSLNDFLWK